MPNKQSLFSARTATRALGVVLLLCVAELLYPLFGPRARDVSWRPVTPAQTARRNRINFLRVATLDAIDANDAPLAESRYSRYISVVHWDGWTSESLAKMRWKNGDKAGACAVLRAGLHPPDSTISDFERSSVKWREYAKMCAAIGLDAEARSASSHADTLHTLTARR